MEKIKKCRLFIDMDGTLSFINNNIDSLEAIYTKGYFSNLHPMHQVINGIKEYLKSDNEVYILSNVVESPYAINEKNEWLDKYLPDIDKNHRIFIPFGVNKANYIKDISKTDFLLDDHDDTLNSWNQKGTAIKLINDINDRDSNWDGQSIYYNAPSIAIAYSLKSIQKQSILKELIREQELGVVPIKSRNIAERMKDAEAKMVKKQRTIKDRNRSIER